MGFFFEQLTFELIDDSKVVLKNIDPIRIKIKI